MDSLLDRVQEVTKARADNYDSPLPNFLRIALYWSIWRHEVFTPLDVIFMMDLMKTAREMHNHDDDTLLDKTGYTISCYERIDADMKKLGFNEGAEYFRSFKRFNAGFEIGMMWDILTLWENYEAEQDRRESSVRQSGDQSINFGSVENTTSPVSKTGSGVRVSDRFSGRF